MPLFPAATLRRVFAMRRAVRTLDTIAAALQQQNVLLARIADQFAPIIDQPSPRAVAVESGVSYLDPVEMSLAQDFIAKSEREHGYTPDDEEVLVYLADERTTDLRTRLRTRDAEVAEWQQARAARRP